MAAEQRVTVNEFKINAQLSPREKGVIDLLKRANRNGADLYQNVGPNLWYGQLCPEGDYFDNEFRSMYNKHAQADPMVRDPYSFLDKDWIPVPIRTVSEVEDSLGAISSDVILAAKHIKENYSSNDGSAMQFSRYLRQSAQMLLAGDFDGLMKLYVEYDQSFPIGWGLVFAETYNDPMKDRPVPQACLTYRDAEATEEAMNMITRLEKVAKAKTAKYGKSIKPRSAHVVVANVLSLSGRLAEKDYEPSAFNLPNDIQLTDKSLIYIFKGRIEEKNLSISGKLASHVAISSDPKDLIALVIPHEYAHGYHEPYELENFGVLNQAARELIANDFGSVLMKAKSFTAPEKRRYLTGLLAYAIDDAGKYSTILKDPSAIKQTSLDQLMKEIGDYGLAAMVMLRNASGEAIKVQDNKPARIMHEILFKQAEERFTELSGIAKNGNPDQTKKFFLTQIYGLNLFPVIKPETLAS